MCSDRIQDRLGRSHGQQLRVVALVCDSLPQRYLACRLAAEFTLEGIVVFAPEDSKGTLWARLRRYLHPLQLWRYLVARKALRRSARQAQPLLERLLYWEGRAPDWPIVPIIQVPNINDPKAVEFVRRIGPDVVCVNGTNLLRAPMLELIPTIPLGIINLHTGLSPYSRGGNCNLFMLLEGHPELVGVTIHHIDRGIDSGDLIATARPTLEENDIMDKIDAKSFRLGIDLLIASVKQVAEGRAERVKQWEPGKLFLKRTGYVYEPYQRFAVDRLIRRGLIREYLRDREARDHVVRLVGTRS